MKVEHNTNKKIAGGSRATSLVAGVGVLLLLAGCSADFGELDSYIKEVKARPGGAIQKLPEIKPYETYVYAAQKLRDPFLPVLEDEGKANGLESKLRPDMNRKREALEQFPLDTLKFVGNLERGGTRWGLISAPDKSVYRVQVGNYIGKNYGRILSITDTTMKLLEIIPNGTGGWIDREAALALTSE